MILWDKPDAMRQLSDGARARRSYEQPMQTPRGRALAKTSIDILHERDALHAKLDMLRASLIRIREEVRSACGQPEVAFLTVCRIGSVVERAMDESSDGNDMPESGVRRSG